jgi:hypothetical protein
MTMHEALSFLSQLHDFVEQRLSNPGPWCWPTRKLVNDNLWFNREAFPRDKNPRRTFAEQASRAARRHWIVIGPCQPQCHATHLRLTPEGQEALKLMEEQGCETGEHIEMP